MKLIKCYISSFGKIKDFTYDFNDGLNVIKQDNGWGKTTLASFIKAMFYGLDVSRAALANNERKKYQPWNTKETFGGYVIFTKSDKTFKLERYFGQKASEDTIKLTDAETGRQFSDTENLGKRIFQIDEDGFLSTTYFSQDDVEIKSNASLTAKYNAICENDGGEFFAKAITNLTAKMRSYQTTGNRGAIFDVKKKINDVEEKISQASYAENTLLGTKLEIKKLEEEQALLGSQIDELTAKITFAGKSDLIKVQNERRKKLLSQKETLISEINSYDKTLNGVNCNEELVDNYLNCAREMVIAKKHVESIEKDINALQLVSTNNKAKFISVLLSSILSLCLFISGVICLIFGKWVGGVLIGLGGVSAVFAVLFAKVLFKLKSNVLLESKQKELIEYTDITLQYKNQIEKFILQFTFEFSPYDFEMALKFVRDLLTKKKSAKENLISVEKELEGLNDISENTSVSIVDYSVDDINIERNAKEIQRKNNGERLSLLKSNLNRTEEIVEGLFDLKNEKERLNNELFTLSSEYEVVCQTLNFLKLADEKLKTNYRLPLCESLNKYYSYITNEDKTVNIDVDFNVTVDEKVGEKVTAYYSKGYRDLFDICKRFALLDLLYTDEKPFIIMDDPFCNFDENKIEKALELINKLSKEYQIVYLVCHSSRAV